MFEHLTLVLSFDAKDVWFRTCWKSCLRRSIISLLNDMLSSSVILISAKSLLEFDTNKSRPYNCYEKNKNVHELVLKEEQNS